MKRIIWIDVNQTTPLSVFIEERHERKYENTPIIWNTKVCIDVNSDGPVYKETWVMSADPDTRWEKALPAWWMITTHETSA